MAQHFVSVKETETKFYLIDAQSADDAVSRVASGKGFAIMLPWNPTDLTYRHHKIVPGTGRVQAAAAGLGLGKIAKIPTLYTRYTPGKGTFPTAPQVPYLVIRETSGYRDYVVEGRDKHEAFSEAALGKGVSCGAPHSARGQRPLVTYKVIDFPEELTDDMSELIEQMRKNA